MTRSSRALRLLLQLTLKTVLRLLRFASPNQRGEDTDIFAQCLLRARKAPQRRILTDTQIELNFTPSTLYHLKLPTIIRTEIRVAGKKNLAQCASGVTYFNTIQRTKIGYTTQSVRVKQFGIMKFSDK